jgi:predicted adenylyl cyclase CyaB
MRIKQMAINIEIKARATDFQAQKQLAETLSDISCQVIPQVDTFFHVTNGRFKLRDLGMGRGQLVFYTRPDASGPKRSDYFIYETKQPHILADVLAKALGVRGVVKKTRYLYLVGQTRIHMDEVVGLGEFIELEVVMEEGQSDMEGQAIAEDLMRKLGIREEDLIEEAYMDLMDSQSQ